jgi:Tfp pilus assembly protein FimT
VSVTHYRMIARVGTTLPELVAVLLLTAILLGIAVPRLHQSVERAAVHGAAADVVATLSTARQLAVSRGGRVSVSVDAPAGMLRIIHYDDTLAIRPLGRMFGVTMTSTRDSLTYDARGLGSGAANLTFVVARGMTADTVVVSRLGRVRW